MSDNNEYIVVAEDSTPNRTILVHLLKKLNYSILECEDGSQGLQALKDNTDKNIVAVISDIMMPNMDGLELLQTVRKDEKYKDIPFILVTAVSEKDYIVQAKLHKVNGYILKPVTFQRVSKKLKELFPSREFPSLAG